MLLSELAQKIGGTFQGEDVEVNNIDTLQDAGPGDISFLFNKKYAPMLATTKASCVILPDWAPEVPIPSLRCKDPHVTYARVMNIFKKVKHPAPGVSAQSYISPSAKLGEEVSVGPFAYIGDNVELGNGVIVYPNTTISGDTKIGDNSIIYSNVSIREDTKIGKNVIIHSGVVIGGDGYGFAKAEDGSYEKIPHVGGVIIEDDVEIGAGCTVDRASFGNTLIKKGAKLDNLVHVAHSVEVGENVLLVAQVGISGSSKIGDNTIMAGKASVVGHVKIGKNCTVAPLAGVNNDIKDGSVVGGAPAFDAILWRKAAVSYKKLPELVKDVRNIKKHLKLDEKE